MNTKIVSEQNLMSAGWVSHQALLLGKAIMYVSSEYPKGYRKAASDDAKGELVPEPQSVHITVPPVNATFDAGPPLARVDGVPVAELAILVKPVAFLVTVEHGTHEVGRVYMHKGKFSVGVDTQRIGGISLTSVEYDTTKGLRIHLDHGYEMFIPVSHCQGTWKLPDAE